MNGKRWAAILIAAALFLFSVLTNALSFVSTSNFSETLEELFMTETPYVEEVIEDGDILNKIVVVNVNGTIQSSTDSLLGTTTYNHENFIKTLKILKKIQRLLE